MTGDEYHSRARTMASHTPAGEARPRSPSIPLHLSMPQSPRRLFKEVLPGFPACALPHYVHIAVRGTQVVAWTPLAPRIMALRTAIALSFAPLLLTAGQDAPTCVCLRSAPSVLPHADRRLTECALGDFAGLLVWGLTGGSRAPTHASCCSTVRKGFHSRAWSCTTSVFGA